MNAAERLAVYQAAYIALLSAGRAPSAANEYAAEAVRDIVAREKSEVAADEEEG